MAELGKQFSQHMGDKIDQIRPSENGSQLGINLPFCNTAFPYDQVKNILLNNFSE